MCTGYGYRGVRHDRHFSAGTNSPAQGLNSADLFRRCVADRKRMTISTWRIQDVSIAIDIFVFIAELMFCIGTGWPSRNPPGAASLFARCFPLLPKTNQ